MGFAFYARMLPLGALGRHVWILMAMMSYVVSKLSPPGEATAVTPRSSLRL